MQDQQRFWNFLLVAVTVLWVWTLFVAPKIFPPPAKPPVANDVDPNSKETAEAKNGKAIPKDVAGKPLKLKEFPLREDVKIGSVDVKSGYRLQVKFDSKGATVSEIQFSDPHYRDLDNPKLPLSILRPEKTTLKTLQTDVPAADKVLKAFKTDLKNVNWEVLPGSLSESSVIWRYITPDSRLELRKKYALEKVDPAKPEFEVNAYSLGFEFTLLNLDDKAQTVNYVLTGPVGLVLENKDYTTKTRDISVGFLSPKGSVAPKLLPPDQLFDNLAANKVEEWTTPVKYAGTDLQYFSAVVLPQGDQLKNNYFKSYKPVFADVPPPNLDTKAQARLRNATFQFTSIDLPLKAVNQDAKDKSASSVAHKYKMFVGPKRIDLLSPIGAEKIIDYGWFSGAFGIPQLLLTLLGIYHQGLSFLPYPYGWAIILLTITVRSCMFPLSRKQALAAAKMQDLVPELNAIKEKYKNSPEKLGHAQIELYRKHKVNPVAGCLPALIQLPIFLGLYHAFTIAVEMRGAPFFWINNLAAPDSLFKFGFNMPLLGPSFNLLPILTVCLFLVQQKLMLPPPTSQEQEMQHKIFFYMTIFMGYMFYSVPAGLCVYFIASSLWGLAERKLLPKPQPASGGILAKTTATTAGKSSKISVDLLPRPDDKGKA